MSHWDRPHKKINLNQTEILSQNARVYGTRELDDNIEVILQQNQTLAEYFRQAIENKGKIKFKGRAGGLKLSGEKSGLNRIW